MITISDALVKALPTGFKLLGGLAVLAFLVSCSAIHIGGGVPVDAGPMDRAPATPAATVAGAPVGTDLRRTCRGSTPRGWIAIDYIEDTEACPAAKSRDRQYQTAVVIRYSGAATGTELTVCAEERVPRDWVRDRYEAGGGQCPPGSPSDEPRVMVIRKVR